MTIQSCLLQQQGRCFPKFVSHRANPQLNKQLANSLCEASFPHLPVILAHSVSLDSFVIRDDATVAWQV